MIQANKDKFVASMLIYSIGGLLLILVLELIYFAIEGFGSSGSSQPSLQLGQAQALDIKSVGSESEFDEVATRPLFVWNRKPLAINNDTPVTETQAGSLESRWELSGVITIGEINYAYFTPLDGKERIRLEEGMYFEDWKVQSILPEEVVLSPGEGLGDTEQKIFRLNVISANKKQKTRGRRGGKRKLIGRRSAVKRLSPVNQAITGKAESSTSNGDDKEIQAP